MATPSRRLGLLGAAGVIAVAASLVPWEKRVQTVYRDPIGVATYCAGLTDPDDLVWGKTYTVAECEALEREAVELKDRGIQHCIADVPLAEHERRAYVHFAYNAGVGAFCRSTLVMLLKLGDYDGACAQLSRWVYAGGRQFRGLVRRRAYERALCEGRQ